MKTAFQVLVVEDHPDSRDLLCQMLMLMGHSVQAAATAEDSLALLQRHRFDVLVADIGLPGMSGIELAERAVRSMPGIRIVFATGYGFLITDKSGFDFSLLQKPYSQEQLAHVLEQASSAVAG